MHVCTPTHKAPVMGRGLSEHWKARPGRDASGRDLTVPWMGTTLDLSFVFETGTHYIAQASLEHSGFSGNPASVSQLLRLYVSTTVPGLEALRLRSNII